MKMAFGTQLVYFFNGNQIILYQPKTWIDVAFVQSYKHNLRKQQIQTGAIGALAVSQLNKRKTLPDASAGQATPQKNRSSAKAKSL